MGERRGEEKGFLGGLSFSLALSLSHIGRRRSRGEVTVFEARKPNRDKGVGLDMDRCILHGRSPVYSSLTNRQPRVPAWPGDTGLGRVAPSSGISSGSASRMTREGVEGDGMRMLVRVFGGLIIGERSRDNLCD